MTDLLETPPNWPRLVISIHDTGGAVTLAGTITPVAGASLDDARLHALEVAIAYAARAGRPLSAHVRDPEGSWPLVVHPDGCIQNASGSGGRRMPLLFAALSVMVLVTAGIGVTGAR